MNLSDFEIEKKWIFPSKVTEFALYRNGETGSGSDYLVTKPDNR